MMHVSEHRIFCRVHATDAATVRVSTANVARADALDVGDPLGTFAVRAPLEVTAGRAARVDEPLVLHGVDDVVEPAVAVLRDRSRVVHVEAGSDDDRADVERHRIILLLEVDRAALARLDALALALAPRQQQTALLVDDGYARDRLHERNVCGAPGREVLVPLVGDLSGQRACLGAGVAAGALVLVDVAGVLVHLHLEGTRLAGQPLHLRAGDDVHVGVVEAGDHLGRQYTDGAVVGGEHLVQQLHAAADGRLPLDHVDVHAFVDEVQRGLDAADASADDQN